MTKDFTRLREMIRRHEGCNLKPYICPRGKLTIGYGRNLQDVGITREEADYLLRSDIDRIYEILLNYDWFNRMNDCRKDVIISMVYNLGWDGFMKFKKMVLALYMDNYVNAAKEMKNSAWAGQVGKRDDELCKMMITGEYPK